MQYDFRQAAINNIAPFMCDPYKKDFHIDLMSKHPELLHVTITKLNEEIQTKKISDKTL